MVCQFGLDESAVPHQKLPQPSIYSPYMSGIYKKHVIAVNAAYLIGNWMDIIFFGDCPWFLDNEENLAKHTALKVTNHPKIVRPWVKLLKRDDRTESYGLHSSSDTVYWNGNSGAGAINLAALTGAKKIILVGFDMNIINSDESHWHNLYNTRGFSKEQMKRNAEAAFIKYITLQSEKLLQLLKEVK